MNFRFLDIVVNTSLAFCNYNHFKRVSFYLNEKNNHYNVIYEIWTWRIINDKKHSDRGDMQLSGQLQIS